MDSYILTLDKNLFPSIIFQIFSTLIIFLKIAFWILIIYLIIKLIKKFL